MVATELLKLAMETEEGRKERLKKMVAIHSAEASPSLVPRPSHHGVPVRGPGNNGLRMRLIKTARYA